MKIVLAGQEFTSKRALKQTVAAILWSTPPNTELTGHELQLLLTLLQHHHNAPQKIGVGVRSIYVKAFEGACGFFVRRIDGTETDFGYDKCIKGIGNSAPHDDSLAVALRNAVKDQINAARDLAFAGGKFILCPINGEMILRDESRVHHEPEFAVLIAAFLAARGLRHDDVEIESGDGVTFKRLADLALTRAWQVYHQASARLTVMSLTGHVQIHQQRAVAP